MSYSANKRKKNLPLVFNKLDCPDNSQPFSATNIPTGLRERNDSTLSANFGTDRALQGGKCIVGNGSAYSTIPNVDFTGVTNWEIEVCYQMPTLIERSYFLGLNWENGVSGIQIGNNVGNIGQVYFPGDGGGVTIIVDTDFTSILVRRIGINLKVFQNGILRLDSDTFVANMIAGGSAVSNIGTVGNVSALNFKTGHIIQKVKVDKLDSEGNVVQILANYNLDSESTTKFIDSSGNDYNGTLVNYYSGLWGTQNEDSRLDEGGYTLSDGSSYYYDQALTELIPIGVLIPRLESVTLPPFKCAAYVTGGVRGDLEFIGSAPSRGEFKEANGWTYAATSYFSITGLLTTDTVEVFGSSAIPTIPTNGQLHIASGETAYGVRILRSSVEWAYYSFSEYILAPSTHIAYDVSGNSNHATLVNGSTANRGLQSELFYDQLGILDDGVNQQVPILADLSAFADGTLLTDPDAILQDENSFLNTGTKLAAIVTPRLVQAEQINRFFTNTGDAIINKNHSDFTGAETGDQDFNDVSETNEVKNIRKHHKALTGIQLKTEKIITNN